jgi:hypothetical protein
MRVASLEVGQHPEHGHPALVGDLGGVLGDEGRLVPGSVHQHDPDHPQPGAERRLDGERGVVDGPEPGERRDHHAGVEAPEQVAHRPPGRERHEQAAHPLDQEQVAAGGRRLDRSGQSLDVQLPALRGRRGEGRAGQCEGGEHRLGRRGAHRRSQQDRVLGVGSRRDARRHHLDRPAVHAAPPQPGAEGGGEHRLAHAGPRSGDRHDPAHQTWTRG